MQCRIVEIKSIYEVEKQDEVNQNVRTPQEICTEYYDTTE